MFQENSEELIEKIEFSQDSIGGGTHTTNALGVSSSYFPYIGYSVRANYERMYYRSSGWLHFGFEIPAGVMITFYDDGKGVIFLPSANLLLGRKNHFLELKAGYFYMNVKDYHEHWIPFSYIYTYLGYRYNFKKFTLKSGLGFDGISLGLNYKFG